MNAKDLKIHEARRKYALKRIVEAARKRNKRISKTSLELLLREAINYEYKAFEEDTEVDGCDLVEWFDEWRTRVKEALK